MTPLQALIQRIEHMMFTGTESNDQLYIIRAMAELLLQQEQQFIEQTYYQGRYDAISKASGYQEYIEKVNTEQW